MKELQTIVSLVGVNAKRRAEIRDIRADIRDTEHDIIKRLIEYGMPELLRPNLRALCHLADIERANDKL